jgi:hypothetical protein
MKKNISLLLIILCILTIFNLVLFSEETKYDFRKTNWGMSKEQVKATEDNKLSYEDNNILGYEMYIYEKYSWCAYYFLEDKLYQGRYTLNNVIHTNFNDYKYDYELFKGILIKKYGKPKIMGSVSSSGSESEFSDYWVSWETSTTKIELILTGDNIYALKLFLSYTSKELEEWVKQTEENKAKINF